jgi:hypothetical protein
MHEEAGHNPDVLKGLEARLESWTPAGGGLSRELILFEAGRAAAACSRRAEARRLVRWRLAAAASFAVAVALGAGWNRERLQTRTLELALNPPHLAPSTAPGVATPRTEASAPPVDPSSYLALAHRLAVGHDTTEPLSPATTGPGTAVGAATPRPLKARDLDRVIAL